MFAENFSKNSDLHDSGISLPVFLSRTNWKLYNISVTTRMVKKVIKNLDLSEASGPDFVPLVVLKNCKPELSYILTVKESCFSRLVEGFIGVPYFEECWGKGLQLKTTAMLVFFLWLVKSLKNL